MHGATIKAVTHLQIFPLWQNVAPDHATKVYREQAGTDYVSSLKDLQLKEKEVNG